MYNEKMSKEELFYLFPGNEYPRHTTRRTTCVTQAFHDKCMQFLVIYFSVFLLVNKSTKSLICILFTVAHVSRLHATCNAIACNCMQCKVQRTTLSSSSSSLSSRVVLRARERDVIRHVKCKMRRNGTEITLTMMSIMEQRAGDW